MYLQYTFNILSVTQCTDFLLLNSLHHPFEGNHLAHTHFWEHNGLPMLISCWHAWRRLISEQPYSKSKRRRRSILASSFWPIHKLFSLHLPVSAVSEMLCINSTGSTDLHRKPFHSYLLNHKQSLSISPPQWYHQIIPITIQVTA